jgi:hypothetical protein
MNLLAWPQVIQFENAGAPEVLNMYQELCGRTVIQASSLASRQITVKESKRSRTEATQFLEDALTKANVKLVTEGRKFVYAVPADSKQVLPKFDLSAMTNKLGKATEVYQPGLLRLVDCQPQNFLEIYAALARRKALTLTAPVPQTIVNFHTQTDMTRAEAVFALEGLAAVNGLQFQMVGDDQVALVPLAAKP